MPGADPIPRRSPSGSRSAGRRTTVRAACTAAVLAAALGTVWAAGMASVDGRAGSGEPAPPAGLEAGADATSALATRISGSGTFDVDWRGRAGSVAATSLFTVDLSGLSGSRRYYVEVGQVADLSDAGWLAVQLQLGRRGVNPARSCTDRRMLRGGQTRTLVVERTDAGVTFRNLRGGRKYCIGLAPGGSDPAGTLLRRSHPGAEPLAYPRLQAILERQR